MKKILTSIMAYLGMFILAYSQTNWNQMVMVDSVTKRFIDPSIVSSNGLITTANSGITNGQSGVNFGSLTVQGNPVLTNQTPPTNWSSFVALTTVNMNSQNIYNARWICSSNGFASGSGPRIDLLNGQLDNPGIAYSLDWKNHVLTYSGVSSPWRYWTVTGTNYDEIVSYGFMTNLIHGYSFVSNNQSGVNFGSLTISGNPVLTNAPVSTNTFGGSIYLPSWTNSVEWAPAFCAPATVLELFADVDGVGTSVVDFVYQNRQEARGTHTKFATLTVTTNTTVMSFSVTNFLSNQRIGAICTNRVGNTNLDWTVRYK